MFIGRVKELEELMRCYRREGFCLFELYAPRSAGKTTLLEEFCRNKDTIYFTASNESGRANLAGFSKLVFSHYKDETHSSFTFWGDAFRYIIDSQEDRKIIVVLDSFDELTDRNPAFTNMLMKYIAESLVTSNLFLILSGRKKILTGRNDTLLRNLTKTLELTRFRLTDDVVEELLLSRRQSADRAKMLQCSEDDVILSEGEVNSEMYKIISGRAVCYLGYGTDDEYLIGTLKEGQCFGEYSLLTAKPGICTFVAYTDMLLLRVDREEFSRFIEMNTDNALGIMRNMANMINVLKVNIDMLREEALQRT